MTRSFASKHLNAVAGLGLVCFLVVEPGHGGELRINEVLASNQGGLPDDDGDHEDWVELYNPGPGPVELGAHALSDDPGRPGKWPLPERSLAAGDYILVWLSGKNRVLPPGDLGQIDARAFRERWVGPDDEWKYLRGDPGELGPPEGWTQIGFDDSTWASGRPGFGYGDDDDRTLLPPETQVVFLRRSFRGSEVEGLPSLVLRVDYDDGFVAFLNGERIASAGAGVELPTFQSRASSKHEAGEPALFGVSSSHAALHPGENVLAVVGLNFSPSSDLSLSVELGELPPFLHAGFRLDRDGEPLLLSGAGGRVVDSVELPRQTRDHSYGRLPGTETWRYFQQPTPGAENSGTFSAEAFPDAVEIFGPAGVVETPLLLGLGLNTEGPGEIRYTLDGSFPTQESALYSGPLLLQPDVLVTAAGFDGGLRTTPPAAHAFFRTATLRLSVLSLSLAPGDFRDVHESEAARGRLSERPAFFEWLAPGYVPLAAVPCGLRLHGGAGRSGGAGTKKSYRCYFRGEYGARRLEVPVIPGAGVVGFDKLVLRGGFNDSFRTSGRATYLRDELLRRLEGEVGGIAARGSWCDLFVNLQFRGLYNVVERIDEEMLAAHTGERAWEIVKTGEEVSSGTADPWESLRAYCLEQDLAQPAHYSEVESRIDLEGFTRYILLNVWAQNHDWISNNWYAARPLRPDGKWIFLSWDGEFGFGLIPPGSGADTFEFIFQRQGPLRDILEALLRNPDYRQRFAEEADRLAHGPLQPRNVIAQIDALEAEVEPDIEAELGLHGREVSEWKDNVEDLRQFARTRGPSFLGAILGSTRFAFPPVTTPRVIEATPARVLQNGHTSVLLTGVRLDPRDHIQLNGLAPEGIEEVAPNQLRVTLPFHLDLEGPVRIEVEDDVTAKRSSATGLLQVDFPRPVPTAVTPARGSSAGGDLVAISGGGFLPGAQVTFGGVPAPAVKIVEGTPRVLLVTTPPGVGTVVVSVVNHLEAGDVPARTRLVYSYERRSFLRGDVNRDDRVDLADPIGILSYLFSGRSAPGCLDAADANDSGVLDLSDAVFLLQYLFQGASPPAAPYPSCGPDPTPDPLDCEAPPVCPGAE